MPKAVPAGARAGVPPEDVLRRIRIPFVQHARIVRGTEGKDVFLVDLGLQGVFAEMEAPPPAGDLVDARFLLPGNEVPVLARCRVAWRHLAGEPPRNFPAGAGLAFVDLSPADGERIRAYVADHCGGALGSRRFARQWPGAEDGGETP